MGGLHSQVEQTLSPKFTPSLYQLFLKVATSIFDQIMDSIGPDECVKGHSVMNSIALSFTHGKEKQVHSWHTVYNGKSEVMTYLVMTWCVSTLTRKDIYMGDNLLMFINAIDGAVPAITGIR